MIIAAFDLSKRSTGYAVYDTEWEKPRYGSWSLGSEYTSNGRTFAKLHSCMSDLHALIPFEACYYEEPLRPETLSGHTNIDTLRVLSGLAAHAESFGYAMGCRIVKSVNITSWRRFFVGRMPRGTKSKDWKAYADERCRQYGWSPRNSDEADALGLLDYSLDLNSITPAWRENEVLRPPLGRASA